MGGLDRHQRGPTSPLSAVHPGTPVGAHATVDAQSTTDMPSLLRPGFRGRLNVARKPPCSPMPDGKPERERARLFWCRVITA